jgi:hypothetical protein
MPYGSLMPGVDRHLPGPGGSGAAARQAEGEDGHPDQHSGQFRQTSEQRAAHHRRTAPLSGSGLARKRTVPSE